MTGHDWVGYFDCDAPLTPEEASADEPYLKAFVDALPPEVTVVYAAVWVHGREYDWHKINVTTVGESHGRKD